MKREKGLSFLNGESISSYHVIFFIFLLIMVSFLLLCPQVTLKAAAQDEEKDGEKEEDSFWDSNLPIALALVFIGVTLLLIEPFIPGMFLAIPGAVLVSVGAVGLIAPDLMFTPLTLFIGITAGLVVFFVAIKFYRFISPNKPPTTTVADSLIGKSGIITKKTDPDHRTKGKVRIGSQVWSAYSDTMIPEDSKVEVIKSEGVHVKVRRIRNQRKTIE